MAEQATAGNRELRPAAMLRSLAETLGLTEGQVYSASIMAAVVVFATAVGIPPTLRDGSVGQPGPTADLAQSTDAETGGLGGTPGAPAPPGSMTSVPGASPPGAGVPVAPLPAQQGSGGLTGRDATPAESPPSLIPDVSSFATVGSPFAPEGIAVAADGTVFVGTNNASGRGVRSAPVVFRYAPSGKLEKTVPVPLIDEGASHGLLGLVAPYQRGTSDPDLVLGLSAEPAAVLAIDTAKGSVRSYVEIPDLPVCLVTISPESCEILPVDNAPLPRTATFGPDGELYVADSGQSTIWRVEPGGGSISVFDQSPEFLAADGPSGIATDPDGNLLITVPVSLTNDGGAVYRLPVDEAGNAGPIETVATMPAGARPMGLATAASGRAYVALAGADEVLVLNEDGSDGGRLPAQRSVDLDEPFNIAFSGGSILVTSRAAGTKGGSVVQIRVSDLPASIGP